MQHRIGTSVVQIDPVSCTVIPTSNITFKTTSTEGPSESTKLATYIKDAPAGTVIAAFTSSSGESLENAADTLMSDLGVDLSIFMQSTSGTASFGYNGSYAFIAQKGYVDKAVLVKSPNIDVSHKRPAYLTAAIFTGIYSIQTYSCSI